ncbi:MULTISPECIES: hypothetical protein [Rhodococcus]|jgi:hypothetical protein|uniref:hypothetical protein n=1 Tax=Rhodococcus TaxID=1827 RepID=UPI000ABA46C4|nr:MULTISPECIES: hypothetical protein [Rhodococcus]MBP2527225.1 hypothetical protein [Rhodococcus sp. PvP104]MCT6736304.1 hypothetical protein [Rhodococcus qingshengii]MEA1798124.1 hypothetical protein [Rhodococcus qingshengii]QOS66288.1 hypothetical protein IM699_29150 [Rhodococcus qingshengii]
MARGRPSKGERRRVETRVPVDVKDRLTLMREARGLTESELVADILSAAVTRFDPAAVHTERLTMTA